MPGFFSSLSLQSGIERLINSRKHFFFLREKKRKDNFLSEVFKKKKNCFSSFDARDFNDLFLFLVSLCFSLSKKSKETVIVVIVMKLLTFSSKMSIFPETVNACRKIVVLFSFHGNKRCKRYFVTSAIETLLLKLTRFLIFLNEITPPPFFFYYYPPL